MMVTEWGITAPLGRVVNSETGEIVPQRIVWRNREWYADTWDAPHRRMGDAVRCHDNVTARKIAAEAYAAALDAGWRGLMVTKEQARTELWRFDLACWCPLPEPGETDWCHAAVLLEIANA